MRIIDVCDLKSGFQGKTNVGEKFRVIKLKDVTKDGIIRYEELETFNAEKVSEKFLLKKNDIILKAKSGDNTAVLIKEDIENIVAASHFIVITVNDNSILSPEYLVAYLNSEYAQDYFKKHAEGTTLPIVKIKTIEDLEIRELAMEKQLEVANIYELIKEEKLIIESLIDNREKQFKAYLRGLLG